MRITALEVNGELNPDRVVPPAILGWKVEGVEAPFIEIRVSEDSANLLSDNFGKEAFFFKPARPNRPWISLGDKLDRNKTFYVQAKIGLHGNWSPWAWCRFRINALPRTKEARLRCFSYKDGLRLSYEYEHDQEAADQKPRVRWFLDDKEQPKLTNQLVISDVKPKQKWRAIVRPYDGLEFGEECSSSELVIKNHPPILRSLVAHPRTPVEGQEICVRWFAEDPEGNKPTCRTSWTLDGKEVPELDGKQIVPSYLVKPKQIWECELCAFDGFDYSQPMRCKTESVRPAKPAVRRVLTEGLDSPSINCDSPLFSWNFSGDQTKYRIVVGTNPLSLGSDSSVRTGSEVFDSGVVDSASNFWKYDCSPPKDYPISPDECQALGMARIGSSYRLLSESGWMKIRPRCPKGHYELVIPVGKGRTGSVLEVVSNGLAKASFIMDKENKVLSVPMIVGPSDSIEIKTNVSRGAEVGPLMLKSLGKVMSPLEPGVRYYVSVSCCDGISWSDWKTSSFRTKGVAWSRSCSKKGWTIEFGAKVRSKDDRFRLLLEAADDAREACLAIHPSKVVMHGISEASCDLNARRHHVYRLCCRDELVTLYVDGTRMIEASTKSSSGRKLSFCSEGANRWGSEYKASDGSAIVSGLRYSILGSFEPKVTASMLMKEEGRIKGAVLSSMTVMSNRLYVSSNESSEARIVSFSPEPDRIKILEPTGGGGLRFFVPIADVLDKPARWMINEKQLDLFLGDEKLDSIPLPGVATGGCLVEGQLVVGTSVGVLKISEKGTKCLITGDCTFLGDGLAVVEGDLHDLVSGVVRNKAGKGVAFRMGNSIAIGSDEIVVFSPEGQQRIIGEREGLPKSSILSACFDDGVLAVGTEKGCFVFWPDEPSPMLFGSGCVTAVSMDGAFIRIYEEGLERRVDIPSRTQVADFPLPSMARSAFFDGEQTWVCTEAGLLRSKEGIECCSPALGFTPGRFSISELRSTPLYEAIGLELDEEGEVATSRTPVPFAKVLVRNGWRVEGSFPGCKISSLYPSRDGLWFCLDGRQKGLFQLPHPSSGGVSVKVDRLAPKGRAMVVDDSIVVEAVDPVTGVKSVEFSDDDSFGSPLRLDYVDGMRVPLPRKKYKSVYKTSGPGEISRILKHGERLFVGTKSPAAIFSVESGASKEVASLDGYAVTDMVESGDGVYVSVSHPGKLYLWDGQLEEVPIGKEVESINCMACIENTMYLGCSPGLVLSLSRDGTKIVWNGARVPTAMCNWFGKLAWAIKDDSVEGHVSTSSEAGHRHVIHASSTVLGAVTGHTDVQHGHSHDVINGMVMDASGHRHYLVPSRPSVLMSFNPTTGRVMERARTEGVVFGLSSVERIIKKVNVIPPPPNQEAKDKGRLLLKIKKKEEPLPDPKVIVEEKNVKSLVALIGPHSKIMAFDEDGSELARLYDGLPSGQGRIRGNTACLGGDLLSGDDGWMKSETFDDAIVDIGDNLLAFSSEVLEKSKPEEETLFVRFEDGAGNRSAPEPVELPFARGRDVPRQAGTHRVVDVTVTSATGAGVAGTSVTTDTSTMFGGSYIYEDVGLYYSDIFNGTDSLVQWYSIGWTSVTPASHSITLSVRSASSESNMATATWGPELTSNPSDIRNQTGQFLQFRARLSTSLATVNPTFGLSSVTIIMKTAQATHYFTKNFELPYNMKRGILCYNGTTNPPSTDLLFGVTGLDSTDFTDYYVVEPNKVFEVPDQHKTQDLRVGIKLISNETSVPIVDEFGLMFSMDNDGWVQLNSGTTPSPSGGSVYTGTTRSIVTEVVEGHSHVIVIPLSITEISGFTGTTTTDAGHYHSVSAGVVETKMGHSHNWSL